MRIFYTFRPLLFVLSFFVCTCLWAQNDSEALVATNEAPVPVEVNTSEDLDILYQEFGTGTIKHGFAEVRLDPEIAKNFITKTDNPVKVYIKLHGESEGVYLSNISSNGFVLKELNDGTSDLKFSWHMVATAPVRH